MRPPGELMQQVLVDEPEQERYAEVVGQVSGVPARARGRKTAMAAPADLVKDDMAERMV